MAGEVPLFGAGWLEQAGIKSRQPRFVNGKPMLCAPITGQEECCHWIDLITWNARVRYTDSTCYGVWTGKLLPAYSESYSGQLVYYGQHPVKVDCQGVYYVHNLATDSFDAFRRDLATGYTIEQKWSAAAGILSSEWNIGLTPDASFWGPLDGRMTFIDFDNRFCVFGYEPDKVIFTTDPGTGVTHVTIERGRAYLQVRDFITGAILQEGYVNSYESGHILHENCDEFFGSGIPVLSCGAWKYLLSAVATDDQTVWMTHAPGVLVSPGPKPPGMFWYDWAHPGGKGKLEWSNSLSCWLETEFIKEDSAGGNAFVRQGPLQHVYLSEDAPDCLGEPSGHNEPSHSACLYAGADRDSREFVGRIHAGAAKLSENIISGIKYGVGSEGSGLLVVRGLPAGEVLKAGCSPSLFAYVIQDGTTNGDNAEEIDKCKAVFDGSGGNPNCYDYIGDARVSIISTDLCACSMEVVIDNCSGPCDEFVVFDWALCNAADCDFPDFGTLGPESWMPCHPAQTITQGQAKCGESFWLPMLSVPTSLLLRGYDKCGCKFVVCKSIPAQVPCICPIEVTLSFVLACFFEAITDSGLDLSDECTNAYTSGDCTVAYEPCEGGPALWDFLASTTCENTVLNIDRWEWWGEGDAEGHWCEAWNDDKVFACVETTSSPYMYKIQAGRCGHFQADFDCDGDAGEYWAIGWDIVITAVNTLTGASCTKHFHITLDTGGTP